MKFTVGMEVIYNGQERFRCVADVIRVFDNGVVIEFNDGEQFTLLGKDVEKIEPLWDEDDEEGMAYRVIK